MSEKPAKKKRTSAIGTDKAAANARATKQGSSEGILPVILLFGMLLAASFFSTNHPLDAFFMTASIVIIYVLALVIIGGMGLFFGYFIFLACKDLYASFREELEVDDREHLEAIFKTYTEKSIDFMYKILPLDLIFGDRHPEEDDDLFR